VAEAGQVDVLLLHLAQLMAAVLPQRVARGRGRQVSAEESALFAACLCSDAAACFVGPVFAVGDLSPASS
jgi:hypothetical protein